jgi:hypothetical protein
MQKKLELEVENNPEQKNRIYNLNKIANERCVKYSRSNKLLTLKSGTITFGGNPKCIEKASFTVIVQTHNLGMPQFCQNVFLRGQSKDNFLGGLDLFMAEKLQSHNDTKLSFLFLVCYAYFLVENCRILPTVWRLFFKIQTLTPDPSYANWTETGSCFSEAETGTLLSRKSLETTDYGFIDGPVRRLLSYQRGTSARGKGLFTRIFCRCRATTTEFFSNRCRLVSRDRVFIVRVNTL